MHLIASAAEFRSDVPGEKPCIAARYIYIAVFLSGKPVQDAYKFLHQLDLVEQNVILSVIFKLFLYPWVENFRIAVFQIFKEIK